MAGVTAAATRAVIIRSVFIREIEFGISLERFTRLSPYASDFS